MEKQLKFYNMEGCYDCPIGRTALEDRYNRLKDDYNDDWQPNYCCCEKINEEHFWLGGWCEDAKIHSKQVNKTINYRKTGIAYRRKQKVFKNDKLLKIISGRYIPHAGWINYEFQGKTLYHSGEYVGGVLHPEPR